MSFFYLCKMKLPQANILRVEHLFEKHVNMLEMQAVTGCLNTRVLVLLNLNKKRGVNIYGNAFTEFENQNRGHLRKTD